MVANQPDSVMARLMGIDVHPIEQQPFCRHPRGLSDNYIRKSACMGLRHGSSFSIRRSSITQGEMMHRGNNQDDLDECSNTNSSKVKPGDSLVSKSLSSSGKKDKNNAPRHVLRPLQKLVYDPPAGYPDKLGVDYVKEFIKYQSKSIDKSGPFSNVLKPYSVKVLKDFENLKLDLHSKSMPRNLNTRFGRNQWKLKQSESTRRDFQKEKIYQNDIFESRGPRGCEQCHFDHGGHVSMSGSSKISDSSGSCLSCSDSENNNSEEHCLNICQGETDYSCIENVLTQSASKSSISSSTSQYAVEDDDAKALNKDVYSRISVDQQSESDPGNMSMDVDHLSYPKAVSVGEASLSELPEEESACLSSSRAGLSDFHHDMKETDQRSPDSILKSFDNQSSLTFESFEGLQLQLQILNYESEETYSEESTMIVSDDEDYIEGKRFGHISHNSRKVHKWVGDYGSRNFSYLVDILDEAQLCDISFNTWHSLEFPLNPSVYESLEKQYGKRTSWQKAERRLLFDRINVGLMEIVNRSIYSHACTKSLSRWFRTAWTRDDVEDELWKMLMSDEKEFTGQFLEKDLDEAMKWLPFEECASIICAELETFIFDELVMELDTLWN